jgi:two-component SAPR family response regulator
MLDGTTVLVIEEEFLIALDIQRMLGTLRSGEVLFARSAAEAVALEQHWTNVGLAIVEIALQRDGALDLIERLRNLGVPIVLCSADTALRHGMPQFPDLPLIIKPMAEADLTAAIAKVLA